MSSNGYTGNSNIRYYYYSWDNNAYAHALRFIITLKSGIEGTGTGEDSSPYVLE